MNENTNSPTPLDDESLDVTGAGLLLPAVQTAREARRGSPDAMKSMGAANADVNAKPHRFDPYRTFKFN